MNVDQRPASEATDEPPGRSPRLSHAQVLWIAGPIMLSNATTPLVGYADTVVIGRLGSETLMGAVAISASVFNYVYWVFGFLRMGTTGFTAQAAGARDPDEVAASLARAGAIACVLGCALIILQVPLSFGVFWLMGASDAVTDNALDYFEIRIWAAPAALLNFALVGWFIGLARADVAFLLQLALNLVNIALSVLLVVVFELGIAGVAYGIVVAEVFAVAVGLAIARRELARRGGQLSLTRLADGARLARFFAVNRDIMIRTFCLLIASAFFMSQSARTDDLTLAANALLISIAMICFYLLDGYAFAAETLVGQSIGAQDRARFADAVRLSTAGAAIVALVLSVALYVGGGAMIDFTTTNEEVRASARVYLVWAAALPLIGVWAFQLDGIYIGATQTVDMRNMMIISLLVFLGMAFPLMLAFSNHGLWLAYFIMFIVRALTLVWRFPHLTARAFPVANPAINV